jgi:lysophospholipase L1-like esterase
MLADLEVRALLVAICALLAAGCGSRSPSAPKGDAGSTGAGGAGAGLGGSRDAGPSVDAAVAGGAGHDASGLAGQVGAAGSAGAAGAAGAAGSPADASFRDSDDLDSGRSDATDASDAATTAAWTGTWASAPQSCGGAFAGQTLRAIVHTSIGGTAARVRFSNAFGSGPLQVRDVHLAQRTMGASIDPTTDKALTFGGQSSLTVPAGTYAVSDGADFVVKPSSDVAVSFFVVSHGATTCHQSAFQTNYQATGDVAGDKTLTGTTNGSYEFLSNLDVQAPGAEGAVVTLGASITDGYRSNGDDNKRWSNDLAARLLTAGRAVGVLNEGISGDGVANAVKRFDRDVLSQPGVRWVIFSDNPINDLGNFDPPAQTEIDQMKAMIASAHARGVRFLCSTLTPFQGANYWSAQKETGRAAINTFIRGPASGCDGVVDQDTATHDPTNPTTFLPAFNSGDSLHPNEPGLQAIANAVDLSLLR